MPRKPSPTLTDAELALMEVLWRHGPSTVSGVVAALPDDEERAYSTVLTMLRIMEQKGYVRHEKEGRAFVYHPVVDRTAVRQGALDYVMDRFFNNSPELLMLNLFKREELAPEDLQRLREMIDGDDDKSP